MRLWLLAVSLVSACIQPTLNTCDGLACPAGSLCVSREAGPSCFLITDCNQKSDGASCDPQSGQDGTCNGGACIPIERCGNGVLEQDESCDCGDGSVTPRAECNGHANSELDALAPCRVDCTLRSCGDGILDGAEQCEGATVATGLTCGTFGYYNGNLACTGLCTVDTTNCVGRCGDGVLDPLEFCDPLASGRVVGECTDFGYSTGPLGCGQACGPTFGQCGDAVVFTDLAPLAEDFVDIVPGPTPTTAWVLRLSELELYDERTLLKTIETFSSASSARDISSAGDMVAVSFNDGSVRLYTAAGSVGVLTAPQVCEEVVMTAESLLACIGNAGVVWWDGTAWGTMLTGTANANDAIRTSANSIIFSDYAGGSSQQINAYAATPTTVTPMQGWSSSVLAFDYIPVGESPTLGGYYGGLGYGGANYAMVHLENAGSWNIVPGTQDLQRVASVGGRTMWKYRDTELAAVPKHGAKTLDNSAASCRRFLTVGETGLCLSVDLVGATRLLRFAGATLGQIVDIPVQTGDLLDALIDDYDVIYYVGRSGASGTSPASSWSVPVVNGITWDQIVGKAGTAVGLIGVGGNGLHLDLAYFDGTSWHTSGFGTDYQAAIVTQTEMIAVGKDAFSSCHVYEGIPGAMTTIDTATSCPSAVWQSPSGTIYTADREYFRNATMHTNVKSFGLPPGNRAAITGLDDSHIWVAVGREIWFWNGATWTMQLDDPVALFDYMTISSNHLLASAGGATRSTWIYDDTTSRWDKIHLPSDATAWIKPMLRPWGIVFRTFGATLEYSVWEDGWP